MAGSKNKTQAAKQRKDSDDALARISKASKSLGQPLPGASDSLESFQPTIPKGEPGVDHPQAQSSLASSQTAFEISFDPLSRRFAMLATGKSSQAWPDASESALQRVAESLYYSNRDFICWLIAATRIGGINARTFVSRVEPIPAGVDGAEGYLSDLFSSESGKLRHASGHAMAIEAIVNGDGRKIWLSRSKQLSFGISTKKLAGRVIETEKDCLNPFGFHCKLNEQPELFQLAKQAACLVAVVKSILLAAPNQDSDAVWDLAQQQIADAREIDNDGSTVVPLPKKGKARMPNDKQSSTAESDALSKDIRQAYHEGFNTLTKRSLRRVRNAAIARLKAVDSDDEVKRRAIEEDIFPTARLIFSDEISSPSDTDAESLTRLFSEKANSPEANTEPLDQTTMDAIKKLTQVWRKHFWNVRYRGVSANLTSGGKDGLKYRTAGSEPESLGTSKFWPEIDFRENAVQPY